MLDLRWPMGLMFSLVGAMLAMWGVITEWGKVYTMHVFGATFKIDLSNEMYKVHSLDININFWWGLALLGFGVLMLLLARWAAAGKKAGEGNPKT